MDGETANTEEKTQTETEAEPAKEEKEPEEVAQKQQPEQQALDQKQQKQQQEEVGSIPEKATVETSDTAETGTSMAEKSEPSNPENASSEREAADVAGIANESGVEEEKDLSNAHCSICQSGDATEENDVLLCDGPECNRAYHQLCHFAPIFVIPRGNWYCLICRYSRAPLSPKKRGRPPKSPRPASAAAQGTPLPRHLSCLHPPYDPTCPPTKSSTIESSSSSSSSSLSIIDGERQLENILAPLKTSLIYSSLQSLRSTLASSLNNIRAHENTIRTYTASGRAQRDIIQYGPSSELLHAHAKLVKAKKKIRSHLLGLKGFIYGKRKNEPRFDDDDTEVKTGIHASQISCVVCLSSDSTDENDILLCDGKKCFRAFHMACMEPRVHPEDLNNAEPWFCPYCTAYANLIHFVQQAYMGDEKLDTEWEDAEDVFEGEVDITPEELKKKIMGGGEDLSSEDDDNFVECSDEEEPTKNGEASLKTENDELSLSPNERDSFARNIPDTLEEITDCPPASSCEQSQMIETDPNDTSESNTSQLPLPGAHHIPGFLSGESLRSRRGIINAYSDIVTGGTIDNAFVVTDDIISNVNVDKKRSWSIQASVFVIAVTISITIAFFKALEPQTTVNAINNGTVQNDQLHIDTQATIDDFKKIIIKSNITSIDDLINSSSSQHNALSWMTDEKRTMFLLEDQMMESLIQRYISVVFYYSLNGRNWSNQYSFLTEGISECLWGNDTMRLTYNDGITCNENETISRIILIQNNVSGTIPSEIGHLNSLRNLNMLGNEIGGTIPSSIDKIDTLHVLSLSFNRFTGTVPISLANMTNLELIGLSSPNLSGFEVLCPLLKGRELYVETYCNSSKLLRKDKCIDYTGHHCCQIVKKDVMQCCPSTALSSERQCYEPLGFFSPFYLA